jgi:hypothetical protein
MGLMTKQGRHTAPPQILAAAREPACKLNFNAALGDVEPDRHFSLRKELKFSQNHDLTATRRKGVNGLDEELDTLGAADVIRHGSLFIYDV